MPTKQASVHFKIRSAPPPPGPISAGLRRASPKRSAKAGRHARGGWGPTRT